MDRPLLAARGSPPSPSSQVVLPAMCCCGAGGAPAHSREGSGSWFCFHSTCAAAFVIMFLKVAQEQTAWLSHTDPIYYWQQYWLP